MNSIHVLQSLGSPITLITNLTQYGSNPRQETQPPSITFARLSWLSLNIGCEGWESRNSVAWQITLKELRLMKESILRSLDLHVYSWAEELKGVDFLTQRFIKIRFFGFKYFHYLAGSVGIIRWWVRAQCDVELGFTYPEGHDDLKVYNDDD